MVRSEPGLREDVSSLIFHRRQSHVLLSLAQNGWRLLRWFKKESLRNRPWEILASDRYRIHRRTSFTSQEESVPKLRGGPTSLSPLIPP